MKAWIRLSQLVMVASLVSGAASSFASTNEDFEQAADEIFAQAEKLSRHSGRSCPAEHVRLARAKSLRVSLFNGYDDAEGVVHDKGTSKAMVYALTQPCVGALTACGFKVIEKKYNIVRLARTIKGRPVTISVYSTSVSTDDSANKDRSRLGEQQRAQSAAVVANFQAELQKSDIVFYSGHARYGSGGGFKPVNGLGSVFDFVFRGPLREMTSALRVRPSNLKVLGIFSCSSNKYYRRAVEEANPNMNLIVTHIDTLATESIQGVYGALDSLLSNKCNGELLDALTPVETKNAKAIEYVRRPQ